MSQTASNARSVGVVGVPRLHAHDDLLPDASDEFLSAFARVTPAELAVITTNRRVIEQARGILAAVYGLDSDDAIEMLKWGSQARGIAVWLLSEQLTAVFTEHSLPGQGSSLAERVAQRSACDDVLFSLPA